MFKIHVKALKIAFLFATYVFKGTSILCTCTQSHDILKIKGKLPKADLYTKSIQCLQHMNKHDQILHQRFFLGEGGGCISQTHTKPGKIQKT